MTSRASASVRKASAKSGQFTVICYDSSDEALEKTYQLQVSTKSTTLNYHGENIDVTTDKLETIRLLGQGCYGSVIAAFISNRPNAVMAIKKICLQSDLNRQAVTYTDLTTIQNVGSLNFPYIISYYGAVIDTLSSELWICMELMDGSMEQFYRTMNKFVDLTDVQLNQVLCRLTHNITSALNFLKMQRILHRDVKPSNMLVNRKAVFKLCDFGISQHLRRSISVVSDTVVVGTEAYLPPEFMKEDLQPYGVRADMWALGMSLYEIAHGKHPFLGLNSVEISEQLKIWQPVFASTQSFSQDMQTLIVSLLEKNLENRPKSYTDILDIPSIRDVSEIPSEDEKTFIGKVLDNIPPVYE